jgi:hypothetical protein
MVSSTAGAWHRLPAAGTVTGGHPGLGVPLGHVCLPWELCQAMPPE